MKAWALALLLASPAAAAGIESGAAFLKITGGARPAAMGSAYTAIADDVNALSFNPAGLAGLRKREVGVTHAAWLLGSQYDFLGISNPSRFGAVGLGVTRLDTGTQQGRDANRHPTGSFGASDMAFTLSFSRNILGAPNGPDSVWSAARAYRYVGYDQDASDAMSRSMGLSDGSEPWREMPRKLHSLTSVGASVKYIQSGVAGYTASTFAMDLGVMHRFATSPLTLGASVLNLGKGMAYFDQTDPLPLTLAVGAAYRFANLLEFSADIKRSPYDHSTTFGFGTEYAMLSAFTLRAGYATSGAGAVSSGGGLSAFTGLGAGFGLKIRSYNADYTFTPFGELGNVQRLSLGARF